MERASLGRARIAVPRLAIGCLPAAGWASVDEAQFVATLRHGLDLGLNFLDTAAAYGDGRSEELVGRAIAGRRHEVVIATKFSFLDSRPADIRRSLEASLKRLHTDYIDLYQQHWPAADIPLADTIGELEGLRDEGKIRAIGVSNWMEPEWAELGDPSRVDVLQACHNLLWRSIEANVLPLCRQDRIAVITYSSLCQGALAGRLRSPAEVPDDVRRQNRRLRPDSWPRVLEVVHALEEVGAKYGKTPAQTALRWLLDQQGIAAAIVGASRPEQLDENLGAMGWHLEAGDWLRLADASWLLSADLGPHDTLWGWHARASSTA